MVRRGGRQRGVGRGAGVGGVREVDHADVDALVGRRRARGQRQAGERRRRLRGLAARPLAGVGRRRAGLALAAPRLAGVAGVRHPAVAGVRARGMRALQASARHFTFLVSVSNNQLFITSAFKKTVPKMGSTNTLDRPRTLDQPSPA